MIQTRSFVAGFPMVAEKPPNTHDTLATPRSRWRRWLADPLLDQLKLGTSPQKLAWTIAAGMTLGIFPVLGTRAWLCLVTGLIFKLNQPVIHTFKSLVYPLHLLLIIPFIQLGQRLFGKPALALTLDGLKKHFEGGYAAFCHEFGWIILRAATAWLLVAPVLLIVVKCCALPLTRKLAAGIKRKG